jgi:hypothetical protein
MTVKDFLTGRSAEIQNSKSGKKKTGAFLEDPIWLEII